MASDNLDRYFSGADGTKHGLFNTYSLAPPVAVMRCNTSTGTVIADKFRPGASTGIFRMTMLEASTSPAMPGLRIWIAVAAAVLTLGRVGNLAT